VSAEDPKDVLRLREAFASLEDPDDRKAPGGQGTSDPVDSGRIFDALHGDVSPKERQAVVEQLLTNPSAAEAWRLAREMRPDTAVQGGADRAPEESTRPAKWKWMAVAAAAVLAVGLGWQLIPSSGDGEPAYRSVESRAIRSALPRDAELARAQPVLRWTGIEGARYRVRVLTPDLQLLEASAESSAREYTLSPETLGRIPPGGQILWQVEARIPGEVVITSPTFSIRVR
jgi:hypothetical protein